MPDTAQFILNRLTEWGIKRVYGYPGDGINGLMGAFHGVGDRLEFIQTRHEEIAAFAATAHAKFSGEVGVCMATSGPGAIHLLNGLYDAKLDHQPVVAIIGQPRHADPGPGPVGQARRRDGARAFDPGVRADDAPGVVASTRWQRKSQRPTRRPVA
jgi:thiamine pyrophosphate-dependent acetolactate synthase large subunit-like protein